MEHTVLGLVHWGCRAAICTRIARKGNYCLVSLALTTNRAVLFQICVLDVMCCISTNLSLVIMSVESRAGSYCWSSYSHIAREPAFGLTLSTRCFWWTAVGQVKLV